jgi:excinuclease ABC subunit C
MFLDGRHDELSTELEVRMSKAAHGMHFELAAVYRDQLSAIEKVRQEQRVVAVDDVDRDVIGLHREGDLVEIALLYVRHGKLANVATFSVKGADVPDEEVIGAFLAQHYLPDLPDLSVSTLPMPHEIIVPVLPDADSGIAEWLGERARHKVVLVLPQRGSRVELLALASDNARHAFAEKGRASDDVEQRLEQLKTHLRLPTVPRRIECCDISHLGGKDTVGAIVAMLDGEPDKKRYRTFHVRGSVEGAKTTDATPVPGGAENSDDGTLGGGGDDYRAMYEVLARRFRRGLRKLDARAVSQGEVAAAGDDDAAMVPSSQPVVRDDNGAEWDLPDLFVVDGGKGQLAVALAAAHDLGLHDLPVVALAKEKENILGETMVDRVYLPGQKNPIPLRTHSASMFFLARARDEAHRFSNRARERLGKKKRFKSALDNVPGIGPKTKALLLRHLGSVKAIAEADDAALLAVPGMTSRHLKALRVVYPAPVKKP